jgi:hypothetical protein
MKSLTVKSLAAVVLLAAALAVACNSAPAEQGLRDSFARRLSENRFVKEFQRNGDDMTFVGPGPEGGTAKWRVHIDSAVIEPNTDEKLPYKGTIHSSWYADGQKIVATARESRLPYELTSNDLAQDPWAFWDPAAKNWDWD